MWQSFASRGRAATFFPSIKGFNSPMRIASRRTLATLQPTLDSKETLLTTSYVKGPTDRPLSEDTLGQYWNKITDKHGDRLGLVVKHENNLHWSFREWGEQVDALARGLQKLGLKKGDRLGVCMPNNSAWATLQHATSKLGVILATMNPAYRKDELIGALNLVGCKALVITPAFKTSNYAAMMLEMMPELQSSSTNPGQIESKTLPDLKHLIMVDNGTMVPELSTVNKSAVQYKDLLIHNRDTEQERLLALQARGLNNLDIINLQFSSGTTGLPKAIALSHRNILNNGIGIGDNMQLTEKDILCIPVPLFHCFGLVLGNLAAMTHGSAVVYPSEGFNAEAVLKAIHEEKCTGVHGVPTMFIEEMNHPNFNLYDLSTLRTGIAAGSPVPVKVMLDIEQKMNLKELTICYGMTETSPVSFQSQLHHSLTERCETVGTIMPHVEAKVVDPVTGITLPPGISGELCTRGYCVMTGGYWGSPDQTKDAIDSEGWMHTGDTGTIDNRGFCKIDGRIKDIVIRGGEKIHPVEVENCLFTMEGIQNVSVIGVPSERWGEEVCAWISVKEGYAVTPEDVAKFCRGKIAHYKIPRFVIEVKADEIPKTPSGKIQKNIMRERTNKDLMPRLGDSIAVPQSAFSREPPVAAAAASAGGV